MSEDKKDKNTTDEESSFDFFLKFLNKKRDEETYNEKKENEETSHRTLLDLLMSLFESINHIMDAILMDRKKARWLSFLMAAMLFLMTSGVNNFNTSSTGRVVSEVPIEVINVNDDYVVTDVTRSASLMLVGNAISVQTAILKKDYRLYIDATDLTEGTHSVDLRLEGISKNITASAVPAKVDITLSPKESRVFAIGYRYINEDKKDEKYVLETPILSKSEVSVTGGKSVLDQIRYVDAVIDVKGVTGFFNQKAEIKAYDASGQELNVSIDPNTVDVSVNVTSFSKQVPIQINPIGQMKSNLAIASFSSNEAKVNLYGDEDTLKDINSVKANVDISEITESTMIHGVNIDYPENVRGNLTNISVDVVVEKRTTKTINNIPIKVENENGHTVIFLNNSSSATVEVSGAISKLANFDAESIVASVDISNLEVGEHIVKVSIQSKDNLVNAKLESKEEIEIKIE